MHSTRLLEGTHTRHFEMLAIHSTCLTTVNATSCNQLREHFSEFVHKLTYMEFTKKNVQVSISTCVSGQVFIRKNTNIPVTAKSLQYIKYNTIRSYVMEVMHRNPQVLPIP